MIKGRKSKENNPNEVCRLWKRNLRFNYSDYKSMSCVNIFKLSARQIWAEELRKIGISGISRSTSRNLSQLACNVCSRKISNLCALFDFVCKGFASVETENSNPDCEESESSRASGKRKSSNLTPERNSPANRKNLRVRSPVKSTNKRSFSVLSKTNINDLDTSNGSSLKVIIAYHNGNVVVKSN